MAAIAVVGPVIEEIFFRGFLFPGLRRGMGVVLGALIALGPLTIDMYLPALPTLSAELGATQPQRLALLRLGIAAAVRRLWATSLR